LTTTVPRHREINEFLARKICRDLGISDPQPSGPHQGPGSRTM